VLAGVAGAAAALGAFLAPAVAVTVALVPGAAAAGLAWLCWQRRERTVAGELVAAAALAGAALPVALAAGWRAAPAVAAFVGWTAGFAAIVPGVWAIAHKRRLGRGARAVALLAPALAIAIAAAKLGRPAIAAGGPLALAAAVVTALRPGARWMREAGWGIALATVASAVAVVAVSRV
jgi:hypothetical protein